MRLMNVELKKNSEKSIGSSKQWMASPSLGITTTYKIVFCMKKSFIPKEAKLSYFCSCSIYLPLKTTYTLNPSCFSLFNLSAKDV